MRNRLLVSIILLCISAGAYSQSNSCDCYILNADSTFPLVPMGLGSDTGGAPYYRCNDCSSLPIKLPFSFCFYGKTYDTVYVNNKGSISFIHPVFNYSSTGLPEGNDTLTLLAFGADIDTRITNSFSSINYSLTPTHLIVQWGIVGYNTFDCDLYNNFQVTITNGADSILPSGNNVSYCYYVMQWASGDSSGGAMGMEGIPAFIGINKGDGVHYAQFGAFDFPGHTYDGPFDTNSQLYWLDYKSFIFNTCVSGNTIPPVIINPSLCDTFTLCALDTTSFTLSFLCPQHGQTATITAYSPGLAGLTATTSNANSVYSITPQLIAHLRDTGTHVITIKATDNSSPSLSDSMQFTVIIQSCGDTSLNLGIEPHTVDNPQITVYPNPNNGKFYLIVNSKLSMVNELQVYNVMGEKISQFTINSSPFTVDLSKQPSGIYFYRLYEESGDLSENGKFVIQK